MCINFLTCSKLQARLTTEIKSKGVIINTRTQRLVAELPNLLERNL